MNEQKVNCLIVWGWYHEGAIHLLNTQFFISRPFTAESHVDLTIVLKKELPENVNPIILNIIWFDEVKK